MIENMNGILEKRLPVITPLCVLGGITILSFLSVYSFIVPWIFACITFSGSLGLKIRDIGRTIKKPLPLIACLIIMQGIMPLIALGVGKLFFTNDIHIITGLVLAFILPTGIVSLMWVSITKGNSPTTLTIILINTLLSPFLVPFTLKLFIGAEVSLDTVGLMTGLLWMVVVPSFLAIVFSHFFFERSMRAKTKLSPFSKLGLITVITLNSSVAAPYLTRIDFQLVKLFTLLVFLAITGYLLGVVAAKIFKWEKDIAICLAFCCGLRNNGVGAALAITYFAPQVTLPIIVAILFQQVLAAIVGKIIKFKNKNEDHLLKVSNL